ASEGARVLGTASEPGGPQPRRPSRAAPARCGQRGRLGRRTGDDLVRGARRGAPPGDPDGPGGDRGDRDGDPRGGRVDGGGQVPPRYPATDRDGDVRTGRAAEAAMD